MKQLVRFRRVHTRAGASETVTLHARRARISRSTICECVESWSPERFTLFGGPSSASTQEAHFTVTGDTLVLASRRRRACSEVRATALAAAASRRSVVALRAPARRAAAITHATAIRSTSTTSTTSSSSTTGISYRSGADPVIVVRAASITCSRRSAGGYWRSRDLDALDASSRRRAGRSRTSSRRRRSRCATRCICMQSTFEPRPILHLDGTRDRAARVLQSAAARRCRARCTNGALAAVAERTRCRPGRGIPQLFHDPDSDRWYPLLGLVERVSDLRHRAGQERSGSRTRATPQPLFVAASGAARVGAIRPRPWRHDPSVRRRLVDDEARRKATICSTRAPGTEYNVYANGTYVGDSAARPVHVRAVQSGGVQAGRVRARARGTATPSRTCTATAGTPARRGSASNWNFERRIVMFPAGFDADGADVRRHALRRLPALAADEDGGSERRAVHRLDAALVPEAGDARSSALDSFPARNVTDENPRTFWVARRARRRRVDHDRSRDASTTCARSR